MLRTRLAALAGLLLIAVAPGALAGTPVALRAAPIAAGPVVTLGDVFENAGAAAAEPLSPAPAPGQTAPLSARFVAAAAQAAGLDWTPPPGVDRIIVGRSGSMRASAARALTAGSAPLGVAAMPQQMADAGAAMPAIRRGEPVTVLVQAPGLRISLRGRAMGDARVGEAVRIQNLQSNRIVEAVATGPGAAETSPAS